MGQVFDFKGYRTYLQAKINEPGARGIQSKLAKALSCQPSHISKVLAGDANLSLEQADAASEFFGHSDDQREYFLFLVEYDRAGTARLKEYFRSHLDRLREAHINMKKRFKVKDHIAEEDQVIFYSHWYYVGVLAALSLPGMQSSEPIAALLKVSRKTVEEVFEFLLRTGMAVRKGGKVVQTLTRTHLGKNSPMVGRHHVNWRVKAIQSIENNLESDLHFSTVVTLSQEDMFRIKADLVRAIEQANAVIRDSPEEALCSLCVDFFRL